MTPNQGSSDLGQHFKRTYGTMCQIELDPGLRILTPGSSLGQN